MRLENMLNRRQAMQVAATASLAAVIGAALFHRPFAVLLLSLLTRLRRPIFSERRCSRPARSTRRNPWRAR